VSNITRQLGLSNRTSIENLFYIQHLDPLTNVSWDSRRMCLRGTRDAIIRDLVQWASVPHEAEETQKGQIYVVQGPPGCGKSSIAHSVAQAFDRQNRLGAAIFLDERTKGTIESHMISATLAFQLAAYDPKIREGIATQIKANISLARADIRRQFPGLIVSATKDLALVGPICIVIDGLHKIVEPAEQFELLTALAEYFKQLPPNFRLLLTSRPGVAFKDIARLIPDCVIQEITFDDEGIYLECSEYISQCLHQLFSKNSNLVQTYSMEDLHDQFIRRSMGMHFWISTAHKSLLMCTDGDESIILGSILSNELPRTKEEAMDHLYHAIFLCIPCLEAVHVICQTLIQSPCPSPLPDTLTSVSVTSEDTPIGSIRVIMQSLGFIKESGRDGRNPLFSVHPSLEDFLTNSRRCHTAAIRVHTGRLSEVVPSMADICLDWMDKLLRQNICEFDDITLSNAEIPERESRLSKFIPPTLQYSCRNWVFHIEALDNSKKYDIASALERLDTFLSKHLLEWIECMSLLGCVDTVATSLDRLTLWLVVSIFILHWLKKPTDGPFLRFKFLEIWYFSRRSSIYSYQRLYSIYPHLRSYNLQSRDADICLRIPTNAARLSSIPTIR
jgi:energy-coupling factor transporter ATP-binding protein EcfA2